MTTVLAIGTRKGLWLARSEDRRSWTLDGPHLLMQEVAALALDTRRSTPRVLATGYTIGNIDATVIAQQPKMAPHIPQMVSRIAEDLGVSPQQVNIKAKTNEKLGFLGREEGMAAQATALLVKAQG